MSVNDIQLSQVMVYFAYQFIASGEYPLVADIRGEIITNVYIN